MALSMKNLATPLLPLFHWHRYIEQIEAIGKFFFLKYPFTSGPWTATLALIKVDEIGQN